ncbi:MAG TPA: hypothetical protein VEG66_05500 [Thermoplasmata archaeon]|jgi:hypothetical protein|nr:hypothetical protein [Thermoplasmata archaeon]
MRKPRRLWHWLALTGLILLFALPSSASAATTLRVFHAAPYLDVRVTLLAAPPVTTGAHGLRHFFFAPGYAAAGVQGSSPGLEGTTVVLPACTGACIDQYRPASSAAIAAGHYAERVTFTVTQPGAAGPAVGFDLEVAVHLTTGWVVGDGYFSTGVATGAATATITLRVYVDLGTAAPTVEAVEVAVNRCLSTTGCP